MKRYWSIPAAASCVASMLCVRPQCLCLRTSECVSLSFFLFHVDHVDNVIISGVTRIKRLQDYSGFFMSRGSSSGSRGDQVTVSLQNRSCYLALDFFFSAVENTVLVVIFRPLKIMLLLTTGVLQKCCFYCAVRSLHHFQD